VKILFKCTNDTCTEVDKYRNTSLMYAGIFDHMKAALVLQEDGAHVEYAKGFWITALHRATYYGHLDMCHLFLDGGANVDSQNKWKYTPLHDVSQRGHLSVVKLLVERGADVRLRNDLGQTASDLARSEGKGNSRVV